MLKEVDILWFLHNLKDVIGGVEMGGVLPRINIGTDV